jgi:hypothetical protein
MGRSTNGTYNLPFLPVVAGTVIDPDNENTTRADIAAALTDSLSRSGAGGMQAPLQIQDGSAAIPSLTFASDIGVGIAKYATGKGSLVAANTAPLVWYPSNLLIPDGTTVTVDDGATFAINGDLGVGGVFEASSIVSDGDLQSATAEVVGASSAATYEAKQGGSSIRLRPGSLDHCYAEFYPRTAAPTTRGGYVGFPSPGTADLKVVNEETNGWVRMIPGVGGAIEAAANVALTGAAPGAQVPQSSAVTGANVVTARATVHNAVTTVISLLDGYNLSATLPVQATGGQNLRITFGTPFANTDYTVAIASDTACLFTYSKSTTSCDITAYRMNFSGGTPSNTFTKVQFGGTVAADDMQVSATFIGRQ